MNYTNKNINKILSLQQIPIKYLQYLCNFNIIKLILIKTELSQKYMYVCTLFVTERKKEQDIAQFKCQQ